MPIPQSLQDKLRKRQVVPFVGAGVSMSVLDRVSRQPVFPSWRQLLNGAADRLEAETKPREAQLVRLLLNVDPPDFLEAANRARKALGPVWYQFLKDSLTVEIERIEPESLNLARQIWRLGSDLVITTNYDDVLGWAGPPHVDRWDIEAPIEQASLLQRELKQPVIWHLHGRISHASQIILSPDGYQLLYPESNHRDGRVQYEAALTTLRHLIASKSLLFIGFSLDDEYFGLQLKGVHDIYKGGVGPHYAVVLESQAGRIRDLNSGILPITVPHWGEPLLALLAEMQALVDPEANVPGSDSGQTRGSVLIPDYSPHQSVFYVPFKQKGADIVGQQQVIEEVRKQLTDGKRTAIGQTAAFRGLGGLGKTQLAIEYAYRYRDEYPNGVIWINADQDIDAQLIEIAEKARWIAPESDHKYKIQIAQQRIRSYSDCLIVLDNLEDLAVIEPYLPEPEANPHILVTSRIDHIDFYPVALPLLDETLSRELLIKEARRQPKNEAEEKAAQDIGILLGGLPLALELAGAYLAHRRTVTFQQYHELLSKDLKSALPKRVRSFTEHESDLYSTLRLSEDLLEDEPHLRDVLDLLTWSGSAPMSTDLISYLLDIPNYSSLTSSLALGDELRLLQRSKDSDSYSLHRLVGEVRRAEIPLDVSLEWVERICRRLGDWFQEKKEDFSQLTKFESEIDHLKRWQQNAADFAPSHSSRLMWLQAYPAYHRGRHAESRNYVIEAQRIFEQLSVSDLELEAHLLHDLAHTNSALGNLGPVLAMLTRALAIRRELYGDQHPEIANSLVGVGDWYGEHGKLKRALEYSEQALAMRRALLGQSHPDIATSLNNVGHWYGAQGNLERALEYSERALAMQRELFGVSHPDIATSVSNVGNWYGEQGNLERALQYSEQALVMRRELFGESHPDIAASLNNVGYWYGEQGILDRALQYSKRALDMRRELFGERHPDIATSLNSVGHWCGEQGNLESALEYAKQGLAMRRELFGEEHPNVATSLSDLGRWYAGQGNLDRALEYSQQALAIYRKLFDESHPYIATSLNNLAQWYGRKGDLERALEHSAQALAMRRDLFGESHPDIAGSLSTLGYWHGQLGKPELALDYSEQALVMYRETFGEKHPRTIKVAAEAVRYLIRLNRRTEAYELVTRSLANASAHDPSVELLQRFEQHLLSKLIRKGFRQPPKKGKHKRKKRR